MEQQNPSDKNSKESSSNPNTKYDNAFNRIKNLLTNKIFYQRENVQAFFQTQIRVKADITVRDSTSFKKLFHSPVTSALIRDYLNRILAPKELSEAPILELACYYYLNALCRLSEDVTSIDFRLVLLAVCFNIAQKILFDRDIHPNSMAKLLGLSKKKLYQREIFLINEVFDFDLGVDKRTFNIFCEHILKEENAA